MIRILKNLYWKIKNKYQSFLTKQDLQRRYGSTEEIFTDYYSTNEFRSEESLSGPGSTLAYTKSLRPKLEELLISRGVQTILDAPCGDYNWFAHIKREGDVRYIGADIVLPLIQRNQELYGDSDTEFLQRDIIRDPLPAADIFICRDCFIHFSDKDIVRTLKNFMKSEIPYLLTTTYPRKEINYDFPTGSFRYVNLEIAPFSLPTPQERIIDAHEGEARKELVLWRREDLLGAMSL